MINSTSAQNRPSRPTCSRRGRCARALRLLVLSAVVAGCLRQLLLAQTPLNDAFPGPLTLGGSTNTLTGSNVGATREWGEPSHAGIPATASLWWTWIAPESGTAIVDTLGSTFDTVLAVYLGDAVNGLTLVAENDDEPGLTTSLVSFPAIGGDTYRIAIDGYRGSTGPVQLRILLPVRTSPPGITSQPASQTAPDNAGTTITFAVSVTGSFPRSFEWQKNGLSFPAGALASYTITNATLHDEGDYRVIITNAFGSVTSSVAVLSVRSGLAQDSFDGRVGISGPTSTLTAHNFGATLEPGEPVHAGVGSGASVWWSWTAPQNGLTRLDTAGSTNSIGDGLDTVLAVYSGGSLGRLVPVTSNNDEAAGLIRSSKVVFRALAGSTYQIAVAGLRDTHGSVAVGDITLHLDQARDNDQFTDALEFAPGQATVYDDNRGATTEPSEPPHAGNPGGKSVWWYWVAPGNGSYELDTVGSSMDTVLAVYTGTTISALTLVGEDDNRSDEGASLVKFFATGGITYRFAVDGYSGTNGVAAGSIVLNLNPSLELNDDFAGRMTLSGQTNQVTGTNVGASKELGEPQHGGNLGGRSIWWSWTAHLTAPVFVTTRNSTFDTVLAVYTGMDVSSLTLVAENDDMDPVDATTGSLVHFLGIAGQTYQIAVDGYRSGDGIVPEGAVVLGLFQVTPPVLGGNDMFVNRFPITGRAGTVTGVNTNASKEPGEPDHAGNDGGRSVWWSWVAPASTPVRIETLGSSFDTVLAIYEGSSVDALTLVGADEDSAAGNLSAVTFEAIQGVEYQIAVDGFNDGDGAEAGRLVLSVHQYVAGVLHANDDFENATPISDQFLTVTGLNIGATRQPGEPAHGTSTRGHSVWWTWTASTDGPVTISTTDSEFDTILAVYTGDDVGSLSLVAENDDVGPFDLQSSVTFQAAGGVDYHIAIDGYGIAVGLIALTVVPEPDVPSAPQIRQAPANQTRFSAGGGGGADVAFRVVATGSPPISYQWLHNGAVVPGAIQDVMVITNGGAMDVGTYQVTVSNRFGLVTSAGAEFAWVGAAFNDDFSMRMLITGTSNQWVGSVLGASRQPGEPHHGGELGGRSVWWRWVAPADGPVEARTFGSSFDTLLAVYQGNDVSSLTLVGENNNVVRDHVAASRVLWSAVAGQEYQIAVDGQKTNGAAGSIVLMVKQPPTVVAFKFVSINRRPDANVDLTMQLPVGHKYRIQQSTDLVQWFLVEDVWPQIEEYQRTLSTDPEEFGRFYRAYVLE